MMEEGEGESHHLPMMFYQAIAAKLV